MTEPRIAKHCFITQPDPGKFVLNIQFADGPDAGGYTRGLGSFERIEISPEHVRNLAADAVPMALGVVSQ